MRWPTVYVALLHLRALENFLKNFFSVAISCQEMQDIGDGFFIKYFSNIYSAAMNNEQKTVELERTVLNSNKVLINARLNLRNAILYVLNQCLCVGTYPWNTAVITPLHKKGCKEDPNNYRAIAVGSNLGKLFSSILLERLLAFRTRNCPDPPNQLGFCKKAQTPVWISTYRRNKRYSAASSTIRRPLIR